MVKCFPLKLSLLRASAQIAFQTKRELPFGPLRHFPHKSANPLNKKDKPLENKVITPYFSGWQTPFKEPLRTYTTKG